MSNFAGWVEVRNSGAVDPQTTVVSWIAVWPLRAIQLPLQAVPFVVDRPALPGIHVSLTTWGGSFESVNSRVVILDEPSIASPPDLGEATHRWSGEIDQYVVCTREGGLEIDHQPPKEIVTGNRDKL